MYKPLTMLLPSISSMQIVLVGCGGTGSFIAQDIARIAYHQKQKYINMDITFIDFDFIEEKNVGRQNFVYTEIGRNKAETLALRYNLAYGLKISASTKTIQENDLCYAGQQIFIVVGAVDNNKARKAIHNFLKEHCGDHIFWLDCGNYNNGGQILLGNFFRKEDDEDYRLGLCKYIPYPSVQMKELIKKETEQKISCADAALREEQSLMINRAMATFAGQYLYELIVKREINKYQTFINLNGCSAKTNFLNSDMWRNCL
jgi:PRTRC genetic system ThiF family protein